MSYEDSEVSVHGGKPIELYKFEGTYADFFYTSGPVPVAFLGDVYLPITIKRSDVKAGTQEDDGLDLTIEMPVSVQMVKTYAFSTAPPRLDLTVYRYHRGAPGDYVPYWRGPVNNIKVTGGMASLRSPSALASALVGSIPNVYYQTPCNHNLFDARCGVVEGDYTVETTATAVAGRVITVASVGAFTGKLLGGELRNSAGERRMIMLQDGLDLTVNFPFADLSPTDDVWLVTGCDHAHTGDCLNTYDNQVRFGGFPFLTNENVFSEGMEPARFCPDNTCLPDVFIEPEGDEVHKYVFTGTIPTMSESNTFNNSHVWDVGVGPSAAALHGNIQWRYQVWPGGTSEMFEINTNGMAGIGTECFNQWATHSSGKFEYYWRTSTQTLYVRPLGIYTLMPLGGSIGVCGDTTTGGADMDCIRYINGVLEDWGNTPVYNSTHSGGGIHGSITDLNPPGGPKDWISRLHFFGD